MNHTGKIDGQTRSATLCRIDRVVPKGPVRKNPAAVAHLGNSGAGLKLANFRGFGFRGSAAQRRDWISPGAGSGSRYRLNTACSVRITRGSLRGTGTGLLDPQLGGPRLELKFLPAKKNQKTKGNGD